MLHLCPLGSAAAVVELDEPFHEKIAEKARRPCQKCGHDDRSHEQLRYTVKLGCSRVLVHERQRREKI